MNTKITRHIETFQEHSQLTGIPMNDLLEECFSEYIEGTVKTGKSAELIASANARGVQEYGIDGIEKQPIQVKVYLFSTQR